MYMYIHVVRDYINTNLLLNVETLRPWTLRQGWYLYKNMYTSCGSVKVSD